MFIADVREVQNNRHMRIWSKFSARQWAIIVGALCVVIGGIWGFRRFHDAELGHRLLAASPFAVAQDADLVRFATAEARPLYAKHCAECHGSDMKGNPKIGAPDLADRMWLYGDGGVFDIERTIQFGIRAGQPRTRDVTEMPAFGQRGVLDDGQINDLVQYLYKLSHRPFQEAAAAQGKILFYNEQASCDDCHSTDGKGDTYYGSPDLTANIWNWGGTPQDLRNSIYYGRHGVMPAFLGTLDLEQIRALAVYIYARSHAPGSDNKNKVAEASPAANGAPQ